MDTGLILVEGSESEDKHRSNSVAYESKDRLSGMVRKQAEIHELTEALKTQKQSYYKLKKQLHSIVAAEKQKHVDLKLELLKAITFIKKSPLARTYASYELDKITENALIQRITGETDSSSANASTPEKGATFQNPPTKGPSSQLLKFRQEVFSKDHK